MIGGVYVDINLLSQGIYTTSKPILLDRYDTIERMEERARKVVNMTGTQFVNEYYFENLRKCTLVDFELIKKEQQ